MLEHEELMNEICEKLINLRTHMDERRNEKNVKKKYIEEFAGWYLTIRNLYGLGLLNEEEEVIILRSLDAFTNRFCRYLESKIQIQGLEK